MAVNILPVKITLAADSSIPAEVRLARITAIDGKTETQTTLYTVPTGKVLIMPKVMLRMTSASNVTGVATVTVGITAGFNTIIASTALTDFDTTGEVIVLNASAPFASIAAGGVVKIDIATAATTTGAEDTYTFEAHAFGFLIDA